MEVWQPDPDWYLDHIVVPSGPDYLNLGPIRLWRASWEARVAELRPKSGRYRFDMLSRERRVVLEADGKLKYRDRELWHEKRRQERLERLGCRVVRVMWDDIESCWSDTLERIRQALAAPPPLIPARGR